MKALLEYWTDHGTKFLGGLAAIVSALMVVPELLTPGQSKVLQIANIILGALTVRRGFTNSQRNADV